MIKLGILALFLILGKHFHFLSILYNISCGFVVYGLYYVEACSYYIQYVKDFYHKMILHFVKCFSCIYWDEQVIFTFHFIGVMYYRGPKSFRHQGPVSWNTLFSWSSVGEDGCQMIKIHYIYCALYFYYYIVIYNEIIIQITIMQNQWEPWACFPATRQFPLKVMGDSVTPKLCCLCSVYSVISFGHCPYRKPCFIRIGCGKMEAGFSVLLWQYQDIPPWL